MSGQNHKVKTTKKTSGHTPTYAPAYFSYRTRDMLEKDREIRCSVKPSDVGKIHKSVL